MLEFHVITTAAAVDDLSNQLELLGAVAVTWQDAADQPIYEPKPNQILAWDDIHLSAFFADLTSQAVVTAYLAKQQASQHIKSYYSQETQAEDWEKTTQAQFVPQQFGRQLWICPSWCTPVDPNAVNVMFNAGLAFGTGSHATTALCLEWLAANIHGGETLVDYGCGSGILAVAALKLGAKQVTAVDHDPQALVACQMNAELNQFSTAVLHTCLPEDDVSAKIDIVIANIIADSLMTLAPTLATMVRPGGQLILSGVKTHQVDAVCAAYLPWCQLTVSASSGEWVRLDAVLMR